MVDVLLIEGMSFVGVVRRLKFIGISLSMFSNKMPSINRMIAFYHIANYICIDRFFTVVTRINRRFTAPVKYTSKCLIRSSDTEILFEQKQFYKMMINYDVNDDRKLIKRK